MIVAVASGKGGTGKTTVAVALAQSLPKAFLIDADVEEPNVHVFLRPRIEKKEAVYRMVPGVEGEKCSFCGKCKEICRFNAISVFQQVILIFPEMCHGCYGCVEVCPEGCLHPGQRLVGFLYTGQGKGVRMAYGALEVGEPMPSPLIKSLKKNFLKIEKHTIIDCPPGASCPVLESMKGVDFCLLVTEPTPFGLHDLKQVYGAVKALGIPAGVIINRAGESYEPLYRFLEEENLSLLLEIPHRREIAEGYARGKTLLEIDPAFGETFRTLWTRINSMK